MLLGADDQNAPATVRNHLADQECHGVQVMRHDVRLDPAVAGDGRQRPVNRAVSREDRIVGYGQDGPPLVFDDQLPPAPDLEASGPGGDDLDERIRPGVDALARQAGDRQRAIVDDADG